MSCCLTYLAPEDVLSVFICPMCEKVAEEPMMCEEEEHLVCTPCYQSRGSTACRTCKGAVRPAKHLTKHWLLLQCQCPYSGCLFTATRKEMQDHLAHCPHQHQLCNTCQHLPFLLSKGPSPTDTSASLLRKLEQSEALKQQYEKENIQLAVELADERFPGLRGRLERFYKKYGPEKIPTIPFMLACYRGREVLLMKIIVQKYRDTPLAPAYGPPRLGPHNVEWEDDVGNSCGGCRTSFSFMTRRHHCRACGRLYCGKCTSFKARVVKGGKPERVCGACYAVGGAYSKIPSPPSPALTTCGSDTTSSSASTMCSIPVAN